MWTHSNKTISKMLRSLAAITISISLLFIPYLLSQQITIPNNHYIDQIAFAYHGKEISQKLNYAHFLPLKMNNQTHQVKVIVNYSVNEPSSVVINKNMNAIMKIYNTSNGTLIKTSSFPKGFIITSTKGQSQLATIIPDNKIKSVKAAIMFTNAAKNANFSNPLSTNLDFGQKIPP